MPAIVGSITVFIITVFNSSVKIGTGLTASSEQAQQMHAHIRKLLTNTYSSEVANDISILYGGSVKAANAAELFAQHDIDGALVGGASLIAKEFAAIINCL